MPFHLAFRDPPLTLDATHRFAERSRTQSCHGLEDSPGPPEQPWWPCNPMRRVGWEHECGGASLYGGNPHPQEVQDVEGTGKVGHRSTKASPKISLEHRKRAGLRAGERKGSYLHNLPQVLHVHFLCLYQFTQDIPGKRAGVHILGLATTSFLD